jgi:hypothetical protein
LGGGTDRRHEGMTLDEIKAFTRAADEYLSADSAAGDKLLPILRDMMAKHDARAFKYGGWMFIPFVKPDGGTFLYVFPENPILGFERIG